MKTISKWPYPVSKILLMMTFITLAASSHAASVFVKPVVFYCSETAPSKIQFDVFVKNEGIDVIGYRSHTLRFTMNRFILPGGEMKGGTITYVLGTGDSRLRALQNTYFSASSFIITSTRLQVNLGSGGTVYNQNTAPRVNPGESIWLGTFEVTAQMNWVAGISANPVWLVRGTSISVYDSPPSTAIATVCSGNPKDVDVEFPEAFSAGNLALKTNNGYKSIATRTKAFTSYSCDDSNHRIGVASVSLLKVYPNPTSGKLSISFDAADKEKYILCIVGLLGNVLIREENTAQKGFNQHEIDLSTFAKGMYSLTIDREGMEMQMIRIVVE